MFLETTRRDFDKLADQASDTFLTKSEDLSNVLAHLAKQERLNPVEIRRLVEKANTSSMVKLLRASRDKKAEFSLADYADVLRQVYPEQEDSADEKSPRQEKTAAEIPGHFPDRRRHQELSAVVLPRLEKVAEARRPPAPAQAFRLMRQREALLQQKIAVELEVHRCADALISDYSRLNGPDFCKFANEAYTIHGEPVKPLLASLAKALREPAELTKLAGIVNNTTQAHQWLCTAQGGLAQLLKLAEDLADIDAAIEQSWAEVLNHGDH